MTWHLQWLWITHLFVELQLPTMGFMCHNVVFTQCHKLQYPQLSPTDRDLGMMFFFFGHHDVLFIFLNSVYRITFVYIDFCVASKRMNQATHRIHLKLEIPLIHGLDCLMRQLLWQQKSEHDFLFTMGNGVASSNSTWIWKSHHWWFSQGSHEIFHGWNPWAARSPCMESWEHAAMWLLKQGSLWVGSWLSTNLWRLNGEDKPSLRSKRRLWTNLRSGHFDIFEVTY